MRSREPPRRSWRLYAALALIVLASALLLQDALTRAIARWLASVWVATVDLLLRLVSAPLG